jgi:hypothetical protein
VYVARGVVTTLAEALPVTTVPVGVVTGVGLGTVEAAVDLTELDAFVRLQSVCPKHISFTVHSIVSFAIGLIDKSSCSPEISINLYIVL